MAELPRPYQRFIKEFKEVAAAYDQLGSATRAGGPLDEKSCELIKLGIAIGAGLEGAVHSHTRRALEAGASPPEIRHTVLLALTTIGFPSMIAALTWVEDVLGSKGKRTTTARTGSPFDGRSPMAQRTTRTR